MFPYKAAYLIPLTPNNYFQDLSLSPICPQFIPSTQPYHAATALTGKLHSHLSYPIIAFIPIVSRPHPPKTSASSAPPDCSSALLRRPRFLPKGGSYSPRDRRIDHRQVRLRTGMKRMRDRHTMSLRSSLQRQRLRHLVTTDGRGATSVVN